MKHQTWISLALLLVLCGCAHRQPLPDPGLGPDLLWSDQSNRARLLSKISGRLTLSYEGNGQSVSGHGQVLADLKGKLRIELRDPLGRVQYLALLSKEHLVAYYPSEKAAYSDNRSGEKYLKKFLNIELSFADLEQLFLGLLPEGSSKGDEWKWDPNEGVYATSVKRGDRRYSVEVDGKLGAIRKLTIELPRQKIEVVYSEFKVAGGNVNTARDSVWLAHVVEIHHQASQSSIEVDWKEVHPASASVVDREDLFRFQPPEGTKNFSLD
jgi:hypothetical protein